ncbi:MAG: DUF5915 domain-containing protein [Gemmatimonadales bacterium]
MAREVSVRRIEVMSSDAELVRLVAKPNFRSLGRRFGKETPRVAKAVAGLGAASRSARSGRRERGARARRRAARILPEDVVVERQVTSDWLVQAAGPFVAAVDPTLDRELRLEGTSRGKWCASGAAPQEAGGLRVHHQDRARDRREDGDVLGAVEAGDRRFVQGERSRGPSSSGRRSTFRMRAMRHQSTSTTMCHPGRRSLDERRPGVLLGERMNKEQLKHLESRLKDERSRVMKELGHYDDTFNSTLQGSDGDLSSYSFHMADQGTDTMEREEAVPLRLAGRALPLA